MARAPGRLALLIAKSGPKQDSGDDSTADIDHAAQGVIDALDSKDPEAVKSALCDFIDAHLDAKDSGEGYDDDKS